MVLNQNVINVAVDVLAQTRPLPFLETFPKLFPLLCSLVWIVGRFGWSCPWQARSGTATFECFASIDFFHTLPLPFAPHFPQFLGVVASSLTQEPEPSLLKLPQIESGCNFLWASLALCWGLQPYFSIFCLLRAVRGGVAHMLDVIGAAVVANIRFRNNEESTSEEAWNVSFITIWRRELRACNIEGNSFWVLLSKSL